MDGADPLPDHVVAEYLGEGGEPAETAVALYDGVFVLMGVSFGALFLGITHTDRLMGRLRPPEVVRSARLRFTLGLAVYTVDPPVLIAAVAEVPRGSAQRRVNSACSPTATTPQTPARSPSS